MYAVLGVTGRVGGATARALLAAGQAVRAVVRHPAQAASWTALGAEAAVADPRDAAALRAALTGVAGAFVVAPGWGRAPDPRAEHRRCLAALSAALRAAAVPQVVGLSAVGAQHAHGVGAIGLLHELERMLHQLPVPTAVIRAAWLMENFREVVGPARQSGQVPSPLSPPGRPIPMVAATDVGQLAARTLRQSWAGSRVLELGGPCAYSPNDVTRLLSYLLGQPLQTCVLTPDEYAATCAARGQSPAAAALLAGAIAAINSGRVAFARFGPEQHTGQTLLEDVLQQIVAAVP